MGAHDWTNVGHDDGKLGFDVRDETVERRDIGFAACSVDEREATQRRASARHVGDGGEGLRAGSLATRFGDDAVLEFDEWLDGQNLAEQGLGPADATPP